jgi:predicted secreted protein
MSTLALSAQGMTLAMSAVGSPEAFVVIPEINSISGPTGQANEIDATDLSSTAKEYKIGLKDHGEMSLDMFYIPDNSTHALVRAAFADGVVRLFRLTFTDTAPAKIWEFQGYVKGFSIAAGVDQILTVTVPIRVTGDITEYN